eukprot:TRINITY_DN1245_c0_g1_i2.p1 TRINITY_DN1245_c0_g1~~TRINITY_DN1245_c0_g1_i2.p1  ORF type:complete len:966 (-),score=297.21 TRINITY_DN1245_c0_g1_i2:130-3027(-)
MLAAIKGVTSFIGRVKSSSNALEEETKVKQELARVRRKLANKGLSGTNRKKCIWKLIYITMIGYDVDFGQTEAAFLVNSGEFMEKVAGYVSISILFDNTSANQLEFAINSIKSDLMSDLHPVRSIVLATLANSPFDIFIEKLGSVIIQIAFEETSRSSSIQKKALTCLSSFLRKDPKLYQEQWVEKARRLVEKPDIGVALAAAIFIESCIKVKGSTKLVGVARPIISIIKKLIEQNSMYSHEYIYYGTLCPWLQVKLLKLLQLFPFPEDEDDAVLIQKCILSVLTKTDIGPNINKNNSDHSILFEAINLTLHYGQHVTSSTYAKALEILNRYIGVREPNIRYLALESMARMKDRPEAASALGKVKNLVLISLRDGDPSIRKRALDVLFSLCTKEFATSIVEDLLDYLTEKDPYLKEELVLKIALIAEKFGDSIYWYIDVTIRMLQVAGSHMSNDVWYRIAQILTGFEGTELDFDIQNYAAAKVLNSLKAAHIHDPLVKLAAYVLGEYGNTIVESEEDVVKQYKALMKHYDSCNTDTKCMILTALVKTASRSKAVKQKVTSFLKANLTQWELDLQQRAVEYLAFLQSAEFEEKKEQVLDRVPGFPEGFLYNNVILRSLHQFQLKNHEKREVEDGVEETKQPATVLKSREKPPKQHNTELLAAFSNDSDSISSHPIYSKHRADFAKQLCISPNEVMPSFVPLSNVKYFKQLMMNDVKEGLLFEDEAIAINTRIKFNSFMCRCLLKVTPKKAKMKSVTPELMNTKGFILECSKEKYDLSTNSASFIVQAMACSPAPSAPSFRIFYTLDTHSAKTEELALPILMTSFIEPLEASLDYGHSLWSKLADCSGALDSIVPNPAPPQLTHIQVMTKLAQLLHQVFGLYVIPPPNETSFTSLFALGNLLLKHPSQKSFPNSQAEIRPPAKIPIIAQIAFYPEMTKEEFRISIRSEDKGATASVLSALKLFINKS